MEILVRIQICDYDEAWVTGYRSLSQDISAHLSRHLAQPPAIEHIGSTAIVGCAAKPVIDVLVALPADVLEEPFVTTELESLGLDEVHTRSPLGRRLFVRRQDTGSANIHVVEEHGQLWTLLLSIRDLLRARPDLAAEYVELKRALAAKYPKDLRAYSRGKSPFFQKALTSLEGHGRVLPSMDDASLDYISWAPPPPGPGPSPIPTPDPTSKPYWYAVGPKTSQLSLVPDGGPGTINNPALGPNCRYGRDFEPGDPRDDGSYSFWPLSGYQYVQLGMSSDQGYEVRGVN
jgi:GrpB-like predicted nucleotidyltransferase (UPF0157 family)